ncbi:hypothetical protein E2C01_020511 [Portunus trituberculatus]|uniref:Uncharacterized protein n=1 Tax=Portunus trituberculatus TaxID=210409 RepID=A0A5B7DZY7_PORTR|nr:hypothetical protein [Portunus trituberculatus]
MSDAIVGCVAWCGGGWRMWCIAGGGSSDSPASASEMRHCHGGASKKPPLQHDIPVVSVSSEVSVAVNPRF